MIKYELLGALARDNGEPTGASRPFDRNRSGFVVSEGGGVVILEELEHALARGAKIYAEMVGYGASCDVSNGTLCDPDGDGLARAMTMALKDAGMSPQDISYISAHAVSSPVGDAAETRAIKQVFGKHAYEMPVSSIKSMTGDLDAASGGVQLISGVLAMENGLIPPTINYDEPDPECDLDYVPNSARQCEVVNVMVNSFGSGGQNAALIARKFEE